MSTFANGKVVSIEGGSAGGGAATADKQDIGNNSLSSIDTKLTVLNAKDFATSNKQDTQIISLSSIDTKLSSQATTDKQDIGNLSLSSIDNKIPTLGQALAASSVPIVLTALQLSTLTPPAAITGFATETTLNSLNSKVTAVNTGAVVISSSALPTGASTSALQTSGNASLTSIDGKLIILNSKDFATETTLASINTKLPPTLGAQQTSNSLAVNIASDQTVNTLDGGISTVVDGGVGALRVIQQPVADDAYCYNWFTNFGVNATLNISTTRPSIVYSVSCQNFNATLRYIQIWDSATTAGNGSLLFTYSVPANSAVLIGTDIFGINGIAAVNNGLAFGFSTTATTYTAGSAADQITQIAWKV